MQQSGKHSRRSRTTDHHHEGDKRRTSNAPRCSYGSLAADIAEKPEPSRPSVTGSGHMALQVHPNTIIAHAIDLGNLGST